MRRMLRKIIKTREGGSDEEEEEDGEATETQKRKGVNANNLRLRQIRRGELIEKERVEDNGRKARRRREGVQGGWKRLNKARG